MKAIEVRNLKKSFRVKVKEKGFKGSTCIHLYNYSIGSIRIQQRTEKVFFE